MPRRTVLLISENEMKVSRAATISNIVDITNYIMMAYGQPLHCFDADMVTGHKIVVRTQPEGTKFVTLDGEEHTLGEHDLSICNAEEPMCIAGIFGGKGSGTYETTKDVVLESAYFHPTWIRKSARRHGLSTDASYRFERGVDPNGQIYALKQAAILCKQLAGGKVSMQIKDVYPEPMQDFPVRLNYEYAHRLIGKEIGAETIKNIATSLEMKIVKEDAEGIDLLVPAYRVDVQRPCDVVEDILRIYGYNNVEIPTQLKSSLTVQGDEDKAYHSQNLVAEQLVGEGFMEILNNSLSKASYYTDFDLNKYPNETTVKVMNPLSADLGVMRQTMLFGGLESVVRNINHKSQNLKFFEVGNTYIYNKENVGFARANNQAIRQAKGEYVLLLNPDTVLPEQTLEEALLFMDTHPCVGAAGVKMLTDDGRFLRESKRGYPTLAATFGKLSGLGKLFPRSKGLGGYYCNALDADAIHRVEVLAGAFMLLRRSALEKSGLLDEDFFMYGEDIDLSCRIEKAGYENYYLPYPILHYKGESTSKDTYHHVRVFCGAMDIFFRKHGERYGLLGRWLCPTL